jgi:hypothetical protein
VNRALESHRVDDLAELAIDQIGTVRHVGPVGVPSPEEVVLQDPVSCPDRAIAVESQM